MENCYITLMDKKYLESISINASDIKIIEELMNHAIVNNSYSKTPYPYHGLQHIERVLCYVLWITNMMKYDDEYYLKLLLYSALYHDSGRDFSVSEEMHGIKGAIKAREKLNSMFNEKELEAIELLIETHVVDENKVEFKDYDFTDEEKEKIQLISNILKDADALDRNRLKPYKEYYCNPKYLRTKESKEILKQTDEFLSKYEEAIQSN